MVDTIELTHIAISVTSLAIFSLLLARYPVNPGAWFLFVFIFYFSASNIGNRNFVLGYNAEVQYLIFGTSIIGSFLLGALLSKVIVYSSSENKAFRQELPVLSNSNVYVVSAYLLLIIVLPFFMTEFFYAVKAWSAGLNYGDSREIVLSSRLASNPPLVFLITLLFLFCVTKSKFLIVGVLTTLVFFIITGERKDPALGLLTGIFFYLMLGRGRNLSKFLPVAILLMVVTATAFGHLRASIFSESRIGLDSFLSRAIDNPVGLFLPYDSGEFFNVSAVSKVAFTEFEGNYNYGVNYVLSLYKVLPFIGRWKLTDGGPDAGLLAATHGERLLNEGVISGTGGILIGLEAYFALGYFGSCLIFLLYGAVLYSFYCFSTRAGIMFRFAYASSLPMLTLFAGRSSFDSLVSNIVKVNLFPLIFIVLVGLVFKSIYRVKS